MLVSIVVKKEKNLFQILALILWRKDIFILYTCNNFFLLVDTVDSFFFIPSRIQISNFVDGIKATY